MIEISLFLFLLLMADAVEAIKCYDGVISIDPNVFWPGTTKALSSGHPVALGDADAAFAKAKVLGYTS